MNAGSLQKEMKPFNGKKRTLFFLLLSFIIAILLAVIGYTILGLRGEMKITKIAQTMTVIDRTNFLLLFLIAVSFIGGVAGVVLTIMDIANKNRKKALWLDLVFATMTIATFIFAIDVHKLTNDFMLTLNELTGGSFLNGLTLGVKKGITLMTIDIQGTVQFLTLMGGIAFTLSIVCILFYVIQLIVEKRR